MRVLVLHSRYLSGPVSGENRVVEDQIALLSRSGHDVAAWTPAPSAIGRATAAMRTVWSREATDHVRDLIVEHKPDVVHVHNLFPLLSPAVVRAVPPETAVVMTLHNYRYACLPGTFLLDGRICEDCLGKVPWRGVVRSCYRGSKSASAVLASSYVLHKAIGSFDRIDRFLAVSDFMREKHIQAGIPADRIGVRRNFAEQAERRRGSGAYFLYIGRLAREKGLRFLCRAWTGLDAPLLVVGEGPDEAAIRAVAPPGVEFRGAVPGDQVPALLRQAKALVVPSFWYEGTPRSVLEAYAVGVPVLASRIGSLTEVVQEGRTGRLLPVGDVDAWQAAVTELLDEDTNHRMGDAAFDEWSLHYRPEHASERLVESYETAMAARRGARA